MMHFTLKIRWTIFEVADRNHVVGNERQVAEETTMFLPAARVSTHAPIGQYDQTDGAKPPTMGTWELDSYQNYLDVSRGSGKDGVDRRHAGRLIELIDDEGRYTWYLASFAWLLGPNGQTIERIAP